jgi:D-alanyl-D-alanine endopeptidase (penicillin-binding protein 7)
MTFAGLGSGKRIENGEWIVDNSRSKNYQFSIINSPFRWCAIVLLGVFVFGTPFAVHAAAVTVKPSAPSLYVLDLATNAVRTSAHAETVRPIASLTKLMTAMVLLDAGTDLERSVAYDPKRHYAYKNWMSFATGDRLRGRDLFVAMLVGSQNIPPRMLVDLSPHTEVEFVRAMNAKAKDLGLTRTRFVDVHGLNPANVSTASDVARMLIAALRYPDIRDTLARTSAHATIVARSGPLRQTLFSHTNVLLAKKQRFATEVSKTGYLDEAGDTIAMLVRDPATARRFIVVTLGEPRRNPRFAIAKRLAESAVRSVRVAATVP